MKKIITKLLFIFFPLSLAIPLIPFNIPSVGLILFCIGLLIDNNFRPEKNIKSSFLILFFLLFMSDTLGNILRLDLKTPFFNDVKLSYLIIPLLFLNYYKSIINNYKLICNSFIVGVLVYTIYSWWFVFDFYYVKYPGYRLFSLTDGYIRYILYNYLPGVIHHTYIGTYMVFSIFILLNDIVSTKKNKVLTFIGLLFLFFSLFFIGSKFSLVLLFFIIFIYLISLKKWVINIGFVMSFLVGLFLVKQWVVGVSLESSFSSRIDYYKCGYKIVKENYFSGIGATNFSKISSLICNKDVFIPHNMYLRALVENGILALIILFSLCAYLLVDAFRKKDNLYISIVLLLILGGFIEDFLYLQRGVLFFVFFTTIFYVKNKKNTN